MLQWAVCFYYASHLTCVATMKFLQILCHCFLLGLQHALSFPPSSIMQAKRLDDTYQATTTLAKPYTCTASPRDLQLSPANLPKALAMHVKAFNYGTIIWSHSMPGVGDTAHSHV